MTGQVAGGTFNAALRERASRHALYGALIALLAVVLATVLVCLYVYDGISPGNILLAHRENMAIWILDALPFLYAGWGQYASLNMARTAGTLIQRRTRALRRELARAEEHARLRTDFFARMSHELRTPLNAILGMSELLLDSGLDRRQRRQVEVMEESARGLLTLINDVLDFSRMEAGRVELDEVDFNLPESLNGAVTLLTAEAERKGLTLDIDIPDDMPAWVVGDPGRLRQIVINLLGNGIKFTERGSVSLHLRGWERTAGKGLRLDFEVVDTGPGMDAETRKDLFEPYTRSGHEQRARHGGTGLGLSITRELVQAMGGHIEVSSRPGEGSVFRFDVRLTETEALDLGALSRQIDLQGVRVLLAEEPSDAREVLAGQLRALGMKVVTADDGVDAMQQVLRGVVDRNPHDIVFADMFLRHLSGEDLGRRLRGRAETWGIVLAMMTTAGARGDARRLQALGFSGYFVRPIPPEDLADVVTAMLALKQLPTEQSQRHGLITRHYLRDHSAGTRQVLLVEDSEVNREVSVDMLQRLGCEADIACNGHDAVVAAAARDYGVILMDLQLPDINGSRAVRRIRELEGDRGKVPTLVFSAGATEAEKRQCRDAGADGFLPKPISRQDLQAALSRYLRLGAVAPDPGPEAEATTATEASAPEPELVRIFLRESAQRIDAMRQALEAGAGLEVVARHAHALRSASRHVTGGELSTAAAELERQANEGDASGATHTGFPAVADAWRNLRAELSPDAGDDAADETARGSAVDETARID